VFLCQNTHARSTSPGVPRRLLSYVTVHARRGTQATVGPCAALKCSCAWRLRARWPVPRATRTQAELRRVVHRRPTNPVATVLHPSRRHNPRASLALPWSSSRRSHRLIKEDKLPSTACIGKLQSTWPNQAPLFQPQNSSSIHLKPSIPSTHACHTSPASFPRAPEQPRHPPSSAIGAAGDLAAPLAPIANQRP
jgi:hypothetical protein